MTQVAVSTALSRFITLVAAENARLKMLREVSAECMYARQLSVTHLCKLSNTRLRVSAVCGDLEDGQLRR